MPKLSSSSSAATTATSATPVAKTPKVVSETSEVAAAKTPKVSKKTAPAATAVVVAETPAAAPSTPAPKKKAVKTVSPVTATPPVVASAVSAESALVAATTAPVASATEYTDFMSKLQQVSTLLSSLRCDFRSLEKKSSRDLKLANKANARRARKQKGNRSPSGFVKPTLISSELATFLGKEVGTQMARTEVTREINTYIRAHSLQDKENGRKINADEKLSSLLKLVAGEELTYFNLQRYMSPHFIKTVVAAPASPAATVVV
jgi:upstream activation factor subunit UAF30